MKKILTPQNQNGIIQNLTAEEISQIEIDKQAVLDRQQASEQAKQADATKKASGKQKLLDLGLSEEEVKALIGV